MHTCSAIDDRDANHMKHIILAEVRKSNAPAWIVEELEKIFKCPACYPEKKRYPSWELGRIH